MSVVRVVLDTNIVMSALVFRGAALSWLRPAWQSRRVQPVVSRETVCELIRVLAYPKFRLTMSDRDDLLAEYLPWCETFEIPHPPPSVPDCRDPLDRPFLLLAVASNAKHLVTGDRDLLELSQAPPVTILTGAELKAFLAE